MELSSSDTLDRFMVAAVIQSDTVISAIQRELHALYPGQTVTSTTIRCMLRGAIVCPELLSDERSAQAQARLDNLTALRTGKHVHASGNVLPSVPCEETVQEVLLYDKTYATPGG